MSDRDAILAAVRTAIARVPGAAPVPRDYRATHLSQDSVVLFIERLEDYGVDVVRCSSSEAGATVARAVGGRVAVVPADFPWAIPSARVDEALAATELDACDVAVTTAAVAIAVTGTIVLDHGAGQGRRALSLVPDAHICVVTEDQIVPGVPDAVASLDPSRPLTWISGPSATSDIELERVQGVHGPRALTVLLVAPA